MPCLVKHREVQEQCHVRLQVSGLHEKLQGRPPALATLVGAACDCTDTWYTLCRGITALACPDEEAETPTPRGVAEATTMTATKPCSKLSEVAATLTVHCFVVPGSRTTAAQAVALPWSVRLSNPTLPVLATSTRHVKKPLGVPAAEARHAGSATQRCSSACELDAFRHGSLLLRPSICFQGLCAAALHC